MSLKNEKIFIGTMFTKRKDLSTTITVGQFLERIRSDYWRPQVEAGRKWKNRNDAQYESEKRKAPCVWLQHLDLMVFDWEGQDVTIPKEYIMAQFMSYGGGDNLAVIVKIPPGMQGKERAAYRKKLQEEYGIPTNTAQINDDRVRIVSFDSEIYINYGSKILMVKGSAPKVKLEVPKRNGFRVGASQGAQNYLAAKSGKLKVNNGVGLSIYSYLRLTQDTEEVWKEMEQFEYESRSMGTEAGRQKCYEHWEEEYNYKPEKPETKEEEEEEEVEIKIQPDLGIPDQPDYICTAKEQQAAMLETALGPFTPLVIDWYGETRNVCTGTILVGVAGSGKGSINSLMKKFFHFDDELDMLIKDWYIQEHTTIRPVFHKGKEIEVDPKDFTIKEVTKKMPNISAFLGFDSSDAAIFGTLSSFPALLMHGNEIDTLIGSTKREFNMTRSSMFREMLEGESIKKILKKADNYGRTYFKVTNPRFGLLAGGTPERIIHYFSEQVENGLVSRMMFLHLPPPRRDYDEKERKIEFPDISSIMDAGEIVENVTGPQKLVQYDEKGFCQDLKFELYKKYDHVPGHEAMINRGILNSIKHAAVKLYIQGERKKFNVKNNLIQDQLKVFEKSMAYIETFGEHRKDKYGDSVVEQVIKDEVKILKGMAFRSSTGIQLSKEAVKNLMKLVEAGYSYARIQKETGITRKTLSKWLGKKPK